MNNSDLKVAIVGAGRMGTIRAKVALSLGARVVSITDTDEDRAKILAGQVDAQAFSNTEHIDLSNLDALFICTPPSIREIGTKAILQGVNVMVEKPIGRSSKDAATLLNAARRSEVVTAVGYMNRYQPGVVEVKSLLADKKILGISGKWFCGEYKVPWWSDQEESGGPLNEQCTHLVDLFRFLVGEISAVQSIPGNSDELLGSASVNFLFANGALGSLLYSCHAITKHIGLEVYTSSHSYPLEGWDFRNLSSDDLDIDKNAIFITETKAFFEQLKTGKHDGRLCSLFDAARTQKVVDAMIHSVKTGELIEVS